ncbi:hypothetical protein [Paraconexibacter sp.]|uniref:hypothetical protein n=1 Tax=Paraconexibacter sp. TaxID=2949640 RepID=UPI003563DE66
MTTPPETTTPDMGPATRATEASAPPPRLAEGVELIGRYEDSGFKEAPYIARRSDGQMVQMPEMLYSLATVIDGRSDEAALAQRFSDEIERQVEPDMVATLLDEQLRPLGVVAARDGSSPAIEKVDPLLALKFKTRVIPAGAVRRVTTVFKPLFFPPVVVAVLLAFVALDVWLFGIHGISQSLRSVIYDPTLILMLFAGVVLATTFHEIGHATGTRYGGAEPGVMGVGIYIVWPAFYTDITDSYRLGKAGRLRADLGGMYFNAVFALAIAGIYAATGFEPLLLLVVLQTFAIIQQSLPLLRLDGFYIISDLTGVPDMLTRIKPVLSRLIPGREPDPRVTELKPWVRRVVTSYIFIVVPLIALLFVVMLVHAPRAFATGYDSFLLHTSRADRYFSAGDVGEGLLNVVQTLVLVLPLAGMVYSVSRVGRRVGEGAWSWSAAAPARRGGLVLGTVAASALAALAWWPNGDYRPIQRQERGTLVSAVRSLTAVPSGRAALPVERAKDLEGAPFRHTDDDVAVQKDAERERSTPTRTTTTETTSRTQTQTAPTTAATTPAAVDPATTAPATAPPPATTAPATTAPSGTGTTPATTPAPTTTTPPTSP